MGSCLNVINCNDDAGTRSLFYHDASFNWCLFLFLFLSHQIFIDWFIFGFFSFHFSFFIQRVFSFHFSLNSHCPLTNSRIDLFRLGCRRLFVFVSFCRLFALRLLYVSNVCFLLLTTHGIFYFGKICSSIRFSGISNEHNVAFVCCSFSFRLFMFIYIRHTHSHANSTLYE